MQTLASFGRLLARNFWNGLNIEVAGNRTHHRKDISFKFLAASSGCGKTLSKSKATLSKWSFGDDACFVAGNESADVIGVADGVGGWRSYGIDPSRFASTLMQTCCRLVRTGKFKPWNPHAILTASYYEIREFKAPLIGSSTACIISLCRQERRIYSCNLGDSGFLVIRSGRVVHRSLEQQHYFNTPFQLAVVPESQRNMVLSDSPDSAQSTSFDVEEGDHVVLGTDGLFDNMDEETLLTFIAALNQQSEDSSEREVRDNLEHTAHLIVSEARRLSFDSEYQSPFSINAQAHGFDNIKGGKPDDITVIIAKITTQTHFDLGLNEDHGDSITSTSFRSP